MFLRCLCLAYALLLAASTQQAAATMQQGWSNQSVLAEGNWVKVSLDENHDGIYQITYKQLKGWGFDNPEKVGVYGYGGHELPESFANGHIDDLPEVAVLHDTNNQRILFYGRGLVEWTYRDTNYRFTHRINSYSNKAYYFLHVKQEELKAMEVLPTGTISASAATLTDFDEYLLHEQNNINIGEAGREFYGESFTSTSLQKFKMPSDENPQLAGHTLKQGTALLTVSFVAYSEETSNVKVSIEGKEAGTISIGAVTANYTIANEGKLNELLSNVGDVTDPTVTINYSTADASPDVARLNYIRLQGKSPLEASDKEAYMLFRNSEAATKKAQYALGGMNSQMQVWDVTDPTQIRLQKTDEQYRFAAQQSGIREYAIVNTGHTSGFPGVTLAGKVKNQDLHGTAGANLVIVTAPGYQAQAEELAEFRRTNDKLSVLIVTPEQIYNEYSSGTPDATAIRLFMKQMYDRQHSQQLADSVQLRYLLLLGGGSYDNRRNANSNYQLLSYQSDIPTRQTTAYTSDDYFGLLDDYEGGTMNSNYQYSIANDNPDIGIGRLPASSLDEAQGMVDKLIAYGKNRYYGSWKNKMLFMSDDDGNNDSPNLHIKHNEQLVKSLLNKGHNEFVYQKIYLPAYAITNGAGGSDYTDARKEFYESLQQGALLVNYAGHGDAASVTHEQIINRTLADNLRMKNLPMWFFASCDVGRWDGDARSLAEALVLNPNGGAIATIAAARVVYAANNLKLNQGFMNHLFDSNSDGTRMRLGDILKRAKLETGAEVNKLCYTLLGDPSMLLTYPEQKIVVDEVKHEEQVTVSGHIEQLNSSAIDTRFNGLIYPTVYGENESIVANKGKYQEPAYTFESRSKRVFSGRDVVTNGKFTFSFTVPKDAAGTTDIIGQINLYACSEEGNEGQGCMENFSIRANALETTDETGPTIKALFLDSPDFQSGDVVGTTPFFYAEVQDASGFNTTGLSIGHDISLTVKSLTNTLLKPQQYNLNNYFTTFTGDATTGNVKYSLETLEEGTYEATFRIWDAYNNPTIQTFQFTVSDKEAPHVELVQAYPSPVKQGDNVTFRILHNRPESAEELRLQIYTQMGAKVLDRTMTSTASEVVYLKPDASAKTEISEAMNADETSNLMGCSTTSWSATVAPGVYMYRVFLKTGKGETISKAKKLIVF